MPVQPTTLSVFEKGIPDDLKALAQWVTWKWQWREPDKKWTKPPLTVTGSPASVTDAKTWSPFDAVMAAYWDSTLNLSGIGHVLVTGGRLIGLDVDKCRDPLHGGVVDPDVLQLLRELNTYTEVSPSGRGVRAFAYGLLPRGGRRKGPFELYDGGRYLTVTGHRVDGFPATIMDRPVELVNVHTAIFGGASSNGGPAPTFRTSAPVTDQGLIERAMAAKNGDLFRRLWAGDITGHSSHSEADLAFCALLAFWCGRDAGRMDGLFRQSGLMRTKWDERHFSSGETYGERTIATAVAACREVYVARTKTSKTTGTSTSAPASVEDLPSDIEAPNPEPARQDAQDRQHAATGTATAYTFQGAFGPDHFVSQYIDLVSTRTDAASEYAEAAALVLLAVATPQVRAHLTIFPSGLGTNLYILVLGVSTRSRKSTVMRATTELLARSSLAGVLLPDKMSPEAFLEQMARRDGGSALWGVDEFGPMLGKFHHAAYMEDFAGHLLTAYDGKEIWGARRSKRNKETGHTDRDEDRARQPHLNIYALSTPALLFKKLVMEDIAGGLLPRYAVVFPLTKPARRDIARVEVDLEEREQTIVTWLNSIAAWSAHGQVVIEDAALAAINAFDRAQEDRQAAREHDDVASLMFERHVGMLVKVALLSAVGTCTRLPEVLSVTAADVQAAELVLARWATFATTFVNHLGESEHEGDLKRAMALVEKYSKRSRRDLSRSLKLSKRQLDDLEATAKDRGLITIEGGAWVWQG